MCQNRDNVSTYDMFVKNMPYTLDSQQLWNKVDSDLQHYVNNSYIMVSIRNKLYMEIEKCLQAIRKNI